MRLPTTDLLLEPNKVYPQYGDTPCFCPQLSSKHALNFYLFLDSHPFSYHLNGRHLEGTGFPPLRENQIVKLVLSP